MSSYEKGQDVYLFFQIEHTDYVGDMLHCYPVYQLYEGREFKYPVFSDSTWDIEHEHPYRYDLRGLDVRMFAAHPEAYHCEVEYRDVHSINLTRVGHMNRTLKSIMGKIAKYRDEFGSAKTYGQYCARFAKAINAKAIVFKLTDLYPNGVPDWYQNDRYKVFSISDGIHEIDSIMTRLAGYDYNRK